MNRYNLQITLSFIATSFLLFSCGCVTKKISDNTRDTILIPPLEKSTKPIVIDIQSNNESLRDYSKDQEMIIDSQNEKIIFLESQLQAISDDLSNGKIPQKSTIEQLLREISLLKSDNFKLSTKNSKLLNVLEKQANDIKKALNDVTTIETQNANLILRLREANEIIKAKTSIIENRDFIIESKDKKISSVENKLAEVKVYKKWVLGVAGSLALMLVLSIALKSAKPF